MKKTILIILTVLGVIIIILGLLIWGSYGFTKKQRYENCVQNCSEMMLMESNIQHCAPRCQEVTDYKPEVNEKDDTTPSKPSTQTNTKKIAPVLVADYPEQEFYCNWVWPQEIILKETKQLVIACPRTYPWCNRADFKYENVSCCVDKEYFDCKSLEDLLVEPEE